MKIVKVLNNNSVLALNEHNDQVILIGPGIGFKRKHAETIFLQIICSNLYWQIIN